MGGFRRKIERERSEVLVGEEGDIAPEKDSLALCLALTADLQADQERSALGIKITARDCSPVRPNYCDCLEADTVEYRARSSWIEAR